MKKASCVIAFALVVALMAAVPLAAQTSFGSDHWSHCGILPVPSCQGLRLL